MASTIFVPTVNSDFVQMGMIDSTGAASVDNKPWRELVASGCVIVDPAETVALAKHGDRISIPSIKDPADFGRVDIASTSPMSAQEVDTLTDVGVVQWNRQLYQFDDCDTIRSGHDASKEYSMKLGGKKAKRLFELLMNVAIGAVDAVDSPTANCHTSAIYSNNPPAYPTLRRLRTTKALLADAQTRITTAVMHSASFNHLLSDLITNYGAGSVVGDFAAQTGLLGTLIGIKNWIVSDLVPTSDGGSSYNILLLGPGALWLSHQKDLSVDTQREVKGTKTVDYMAVSFNVCPHARFIKWNDNGNNPTDEHLADATKWSAAYDDHRRVLIAKLNSN